VKMEIFSGKNRHSEILVRENFSRPPKLGARSPPLVQRRPVKCGCETFLEFCDCLIIAIYCSF